jgi:predicted deacylase
MLEVLGVTCQRGEKANGRYPIGVLRDGSPVTLPVRIVHGAKDGPTVSMTGCVHGDEWFGLAMINRVLDEIDPAQLAGTLIGFPLANPFAVITKSRVSPLDYEGSNLDYVFPGNPNGLIIERVAAAIFAGGIRKADFHLDYHEGGYDFIARYLIVRQPADDDHVCAQNLRLARAFGMGIPINVWHLTPERRTTGYGGALTLQAAAAGVPSLMVELGGGGRIWPEFVEIGLQGTLNVLKELGMLPGEKAIVAQTQQIGTASQWPRPSTAGWWEQVVELGQIVEAGQKVGHVKDAFGQVVEELRAPFRAVIFDIRNTAMVMTGEWTVHCGRLESAGSGTE